MRMRVSPRSVTSTSISTIGFAARLGTAVLPKCSMRRTKIARQAGEQVGLLLPKTLRPGRIIRNNFYLLLHDTRDPLRPRVHFPHPNATINPPITRTVSGRDFRELRDFVKLAY